jgi:DNA ligase-1
MITFKEPMLAVSLLPPEVECTDETVFAAMRKLHYPVLATLKKDGVRGLRLNCTLLSRSLKKIPNKSIAARSLILPGGMDVELWNKSLEYNEIQSIVMSREHVASDQIQFHIIDWYIPECLGMSYVERMARVAGLMPEMPSEYVKFGPPVVCQNAEQLFAFEQLVIEEVGEGICFRTPNGPYKFGRSTLKEQWLVKLTRWKYDEAEIIGFNEEMENCNAAGTDARGKTERGHSIFNLVGRNTLGAFRVKNAADQVFPIGTGVGLTDVCRKEIWDSRDSYLGRVIKYKAKAHGTKVLPRSPVFCGFRDRSDM